MNGRQRNGFTLIEIMIVVAIVAILASIAVPSFLSYRDEAHDKACRENVAIIRNACNLREIQSCEIVTDLDSLCRDSATKGGLRRRPVCPIGGEYKIMHDASNGYDVWCTMERSGGHSTKATP